MDNPWVHVAGLLFDFSPIWADRSVLGRANGHQMGWHISTQSKLFAFPEWVKNALQLINKGGRLARPGWLQHILYKLGGGAAQIGIFRVT